MVEGFEHGLGEIQILETKLFFLFRGQFSYRLLSGRDRAGECGKVGTDRLLDSAHESLDLCIIPSGIVVVLIERDLLFHFSYAWSFPVHTGSRQGGIPPSPADMLYVTLKRR